MKTVFLLPLLLLFPSPALRAGSVSMVIPVIAHVVSTCTVSAPMVELTVESGKGARTPAPLDVTCTKGTTARVRINGQTTLQGPGGDLGFRILDEAGQLVTSTTGPDFTAQTGLSPTRVNLQADVPAGQKVVPGDYVGSTVVTVDF